MGSIPASLAVQEGAGAGTSKMQKEDTAVMVLASKFKGHARSASAKASKVGSVSHDVAAFLDDGARLAVEAERQAHTEVQKGHKKNGSKARDEQAKKDVEGATALKKKKKRRKSEDPE